MHLLGRLADGRIERTEHAHACMRTYTPAPASLPSLALSVALLSLALCSLAFLCSLSLLCSLALPPCSMLARSLLCTAVHTGSRLLTHSHGRLLCACWCVCMPMSCEPMVIPDQIVPAGPCSTPGHRRPWPLMMVGMPAGVSKKNSGPPSTGARRYKIKSAHGTVPIGRPGGGMLAYCANQSPQKPTEAYQPGRD